MTTVVKLLTYVVCDSQSLRTASPAAKPPPPPLVSAHKSSYRLSLAFAQQMLDIAETPVSPTGSVLLLDPEFNFFPYWIPPVCSFQIQIQPEN